MLDNTWYTDKFRIVYNYDVDLWEIRYDNMIINQYSLLQSAINDLSHYKKLSVEV